MQSYYISLFVYSMRVLKDYKKVTLVHQWSIHRCIKIYYDVWIRNTKLKADSREVTVIAACMVSEVNFLPKFKNLFLVQVHVQASIKTQIRFHNSVNEMF
jgi:hypothetical protein